MTTTPPVRVERRAGQRFPYLLPLTLSQSSTSIEGAGFTQDLSSRGVFFFTDVPLEEGSEIEITLKMPSEITLGESMRVRCRGRILRAQHPQNSAAAAYSHALSQGDLRRHLERDLDFAPLFQRNIGEKENSARAQILREARALNRGRALREGERKQVREPLSGAAFDSNWRSSRHGYHFLYRDAG